jgi:hypothetical protein
MFFTIPIWIVLRFLVISLDWKHEEDEDDRDDEKEDKKGKKDD